MGTAAVGMTISTYALARLMMNLPAGILADRHGRKLLLVWGPALTALGNGCAALSELVCVMPVHSQHLHALWCSLRVSYSSYLVHNHSRQMFG